MKTFETETTKLSPAQVFNKVGGLFELLLNKGIVTEKEAFDLTGYIFIETNSSIAQHQQSISKKHQVFLNSIVAPITQMQMLARGDSRHFVYKILCRLVEKGLVLKRGDLCYLPGMRLPEIIKGKISIKRGHIRLITNNETTPHGYLSDSGRYMNTGHEYHLKEYSDEGSLLTSLRKYHS